VYVPFSSTSNAMSSKSISFPASEKSSADCSPSSHLAATRSDSLSVSTSIVTGPSVSSSGSELSVMLISSGGAS